MKHLLAAATFAALLAATPAGAQIAYGSVIVVGAETSPDVYWRDNFAIYSTIDPVASTPNAVSAPGAGGSPFDVLATSGAGQDLGAFSVAGTSNAVAPVPEPATWAMMLVGFGVIGVVLRRRHTATVRYA